MIQKVSGVVTVVKKILHTVYNKVSVHFVSASDAFETTLKGEHLLLKPSECMERSSQV